MVFELAFWRLVEAVMQIRNAAFGRVQDGTGDVSNNLARTAAQPNREHDFLSL